jgi:glutathione-regulated potassium-efflux system ancillary protein KefC
MALTPILLFMFDRFWAPRPAQEPEPPAEGPIDAHRVIMIGCGRFGQIVTRLLRAQGYEMTLIDSDPIQIETMRQFGIKVFYGDGTRVDMLRAAGADEAGMIIIAVAGSERILEITRLIRRHFPDVTIAARATDRSHAHDLMALGIRTFERETFRSALALGEKALVALGSTPHEAARLAASFAEHDDRLLRESYELRHDRDAYVGLVRRSTELLEEVMRADRERAAAEAASGPEVEPSS